jgi:iron complex transport system substrate-binding protein
LIVTQDQCSVCAVGKGDVEEALDVTQCDAHVVVLRASRFGQVVDDICNLGLATGREAEADALVGRMQMRISELRRKTARARRPKVFCLSWFNPLMAASHWMTEVVELAGGVHGLGEADGASSPLDTAQLRSYDPETIFLMPCDFDLERTVREWPGPGIQTICSDLSAVRNGRVNAVNGSLFHRPGPRLLDGVELLASVLHPLRVRHSYSDDAIRKVA